jgi:aminoglycoside phosphotransferase (APT) family kinase protein
MVDLLAHVGLSSADLLGKGSESQVYALDTERVLRCYHPGPLSAYHTRRQQFYQQLAACTPPFAIPVILDQGLYAGIPYTIERRMHGSDFAQRLPQLRGSARERALRSYLAIAIQIGQIAWPGEPFAGYGEIIAPDLPIRHPTWAGYLAERIRQTTQHSRDDLQADGLAVDLLLHELDQRVATLGDPPRALVHGDYFPGNVFINSDDLVYGVGDFGYSTLVGDARMDLAGAIAFIELVPGYHPSDTIFLQQVLVEQYGSALLPILAHYRFYYALYFSGCGADDPTTYAWCVQCLRGQ